jgi:O-acetyl-ADP-ribose deacetylase (regulator of RNase III)
MVFEIVNQNYFDTPAEVLVNPANGGGINGKGLALEFAKRWPEYNSRIKQLCSNLPAKAGEITVDTDSYLLNNTYRKIVTAFTKTHWRDKSSYIGINECLSRIYTFMKQSEFTTLALPALGCGNGGLDYAKVKLSVVNMFDKDEQVKVYLYKH